MKFKLFPGRIVPELRHSRRHTFLHYL